MRAGEYKHKVWADEPVTEQDSNGEEIVEFVPRARIGCNIKPVSGSEQLRADQILADGASIITVRWSSFTAGITAKWRLRLVRNGTEDVIYNISGRPAEKLMGKREIEFLCNTGLNDG